MMHLTGLRTFSNNPHSVEWNEWLMQCILQSKTNVVGIHSDNQNININLNINPEAGRSARFSVVFLTAVLGQCFKISSQYVKHRQYRVIKFRH